jgi:DNA-directed RNA polymerase sigma subunit (sigma70/sigma32)
MKTKLVRGKIQKRLFVITEAPAKNEDVISGASEPRQSADAFTLYLREIGQTPLITPKEEIVLAKRIKKGDKSAREEMIKANLRLVVKIARDYENYGLPLLDLISEGNIGLMKAVERFDPKKGAKLSTYAAWWIKQMIRRAISDQSKTIRLPVHVGDKLLHIRRSKAHRPISQSIHSSIIARCADWRYRLQYDCGNRC